VSTSIDATVVLGLAGKAATVFAEEGTYLSFPLGPVGIEAKELAALVTDPLGEGLRAHSEFSLLVNEIPSGPLWQPDGDRLWDVYGDVVAHVELADAPPRTEAEEKQYQDATALLYVTADDGTVSQSPAVVAYEQCRDAYLTAVHELNNRASEAAVSTDAAVATQWAADQPKLQEQVDAAAQDWTVVGRRAEIEDARRVLRDLATRSPASSWTQYALRFNPDTPEVFFRTSVDGSRFVPTSYLPTDVVDAEWPTITATRDELAALAANAPEELWSRLGSSDDAAVESVSFEYSTVTINRPWLARDAFESRAWRFPDHDRVLSDGGTPPSGECASFVTGLVLIRNITVRRPATAKPDTGLGFLPLTRLDAKTALRARPYRLAGIARAEPAAEPEPEGQPVARMRLARGALLRASVDRAPVARIATAEPAVPSRTISRDLLFTRIVNRRIRLDVPPLRSLPEPTPESTEIKTDPNEVYVLAFVCRLLPKSPDPDPALTWP
jgi:hypothetical protein